MKKQPSTEIPLTCFAILVVALLTALYLLSMVLHLPPEVGKAIDTVTIVLVLAFAGYFLFEYVRERIRK